MRKLSRPDAKKIMLKLKLLQSGDWEGLDLESIKGNKLPTYRIRCGVYRISFSMDKKMDRISILNITHRKDSYMKKNR